MQRINLRVIAQIGVALALAAVLSMVKLFQMPQGGSVSLETLPIIIMALLYGPRIGILTGFMYGLFQLLLGPFIVHPIQLLLDYPLPFAALGLAGIWKKRQPLGIAVGFAFRLSFHVISGAVFFAEYAPEGVPVWQYSLGYNSSYIVPEAILIGLLGIWLSRSIERRGILSSGA